MKRTEYRLEFRMHHSCKWGRGQELYFDKEYAIKRFDELIKRSTMEWRLIEAKVDLKVIRKEKGKA